ncbi:uncharacterized protein SCHCODRAFT_02547974 [Schizophyllum commune H4-8]|uniref:uncharacterized protein n=1 Tax=Schizophyllum commune (strain H4-8 / FGSC 9210) TaxID=578458 RepID=UPI002160ED09|nr:uncharacterized protein SCHCODRAFT_02547974 [Schizophyllum commune H4-8]KAI5890754.1 hypothetical protein SCHCODRAFT_02547974 [Schizophyllum commune H4-8]
MHLALCILDIQIAIFDLLSEKRDLLSAILVCKDWQDVGETLLWKELPNLIPLLMLMPKDAWRVNRFPQSIVLPYTFAFTRKITEDDWSHVYRRARLVRSITFELLSHSPSLLKEVARRPPKRPLFSQIDCLNFRGTPGDLHTRPVPDGFMDVFYHTNTIVDLDCHKISPFCLPDAHRLHAVGDVWIVWVPKHGPGLSDEAACRAHAISVVDAFLACQPASLVLSFIKVPFSTTLLQRLYGCKSLCELTVAYDNAYDDAQLSAPYPTKASLPNLRSLKVREAATATCTAAAIAAACTALSELEVDFGDHGDDTHLLDLASTIHSHLDASMLQVVAISWQGWALQMAHLAPLTAAENLETLLLLGGRASQSMLADADYERLFPHWPRLQTLCVEAEDAVGRCTLATLGVLAQCCHYIERIDLPLADATAPAPQLTQIGQPLSSVEVNEAAVRLTFNLVSESDPETLATFLLGLFPRLEQVVAGRQVRDIVERHQWYQVGQRIKEMQMRQSAMDVQH